jgi:hypothetical protein
MTQNPFARFLSMPMLFDAEGGGFGGGGGNDNNGASSDGAAGGFADAGNASASFDGSVSANAGDYAGGPAAAAGDLGNVGGGLDANANGGPGVIGLGQSGASPSAGTAMQFSATDAAVLGGLALTGYGAIATTGLGYGLAITAGAGLLGIDPVSTAVSHAAHDLGVLGAGPAVVDVAPIGLFGTEAQSIDAMNHDGGFGAVTALNGTDSIWDVSVNGNIAITDHIGGHSAYWDNILGLPT